MSLGVSASMLVAHLGDRGPRADPPVRADVEEDVSGGEPGDEKDHAGGWFLCASPVDLTEHEITRKID